MSVDSDVAAVRAALMPAIGRDARRTRRGWRLGALVLVALGLGSTGVAAATGAIWAEPKIDHSVPAVPEWQYWSRNPFGDGGGPVLMRAHPEALERLNRDTERAFKAQGVTARCGGDPDHELACFDREGQLLGIPPGLTIALGPADYDVKPLTEAEAHAWLCAHPTQRPGADGGEKPAPTEGYEDC
jgi:hypothetical protein